MKLLPLLALAGLATACGAVPGLPRLTDKIDPPSSALAQEVLDLTNAARARGQVCRGQAMPPAPPVTYNAELETSAQGHAQDMANHDYLDHVGRDGRSPGQRISAAGYAWREMGENLAVGHTTAKQAVDAWLASTQGHCETLMDPALRQLGVGFAPNAASTYKTFWVQDFASR